MLDILLNSISHFMVSHCIMFCPFFSRVCMQMAILLYQSVSVRSMLLMCLF